MCCNGLVRTLVQRVSSAAVELTESGECVGRIGPGLLALVGATHGDGPDGARRLASKVWNLRVFPDAGGAMNLSLADLRERGEESSVLVVSQFTLYGDTRKGRRPSWVDAARPEAAEPLIEQVCDELRSLGATVATGRFRADMAVALVNDGPVTLLLEV